MMLIVQIIFWLSIGGVTYSFFIYPLLLSQFTKNKSAHSLCYSTFDEMPTVSILMAVYNEEKVLEQKLQSLVAINFPKEKLHIYVGNDNSDDKSLAIAESFQNKFPHFTIINFSGRSGKPNIINQLSAVAIQELGNEQIFVITDANVIFDAEIITKLIRHYKDETIGMVGANVLNHVPNKSTIGELEQMYISRENLMKDKEGRLNGALMGPFGACFSLRAKNYIPLPPHFIVDDFYLCLKVHDQKLKCIYDLEAICYEDVPGNMWEEFSRKSRIGAGNFQNLFEFKHWIGRPFTPVGFTFISHKVLRWLTPFLAISGLITIAILATHNNFYEAIFWYKFLVVGLFFADLIFVYFNIHIKPLRLITYFYFMNFALGLGFFYFIKGIKSNVWEPTKRSVDGERS